MAKIISSSVVLNKYCIKFNQFFSFNPGLFLKINFLLMVFNVFLFRWDWNNQEMEEGIQCCEVITRKSSFHWTSSDLGRWLVISWYANYWNFKFCNRLRISLFIFRDGLLVTKIMLMKCLISCCAGNKVNLNLF